MEDNKFASMIDDTLEAAKNPGAVGGDGAPAGRHHVFPQLSGVHTPQDVLVGFAIGALAFMPMVLWMLWLKKFAVPLIGTMGVKALTLSVPMIYILVVAPLLLKKLAITSERQA